MEMLMAMGFEEGAAQRCLTVTLGLATPLGAASHGVECRAQGFAWRGQDHRVGMDRELWQNDRPVGINYQTRSDNINVVSIISAP